MSASSSPCTPRDNYQQKLLDHYRQLAAHHPQWKQVTQNFLYDLYQRLEKTPLNARDREIMRHFKEYAYQKNRVKQVLPHNFRSMSNFLNRQTCQMNTWEMVDMLALLTDFPERPSWPGIRPSSTGNKEQKAGTENSVAASQTADSTRDATVRVMIQNDHIPVRPVLRSRHWVLLILLALLLPLALLWQHRPAEKHPQTQEEYTGGETALPEVHVTRLTPAGNEPIRIVDPSIISANAVEEVLPPATPVVASTKKEKPGSVSSTGSATDPELTALVHEVFGPDARPVPALTGMECRPSSKNPQLFVCTLRLTVETADGQRHPYRVTGSGFNEAGARANALEKLQILLR